MSDTIASMSAHDKTAVVAHPNKLSPRPQGKIFTISFLSFLKIFGRLPVFAFPEQFSVGDSTACRQEFADICDSTAVDSKRVAQIESYRHRGAQPFSPQV